MGTLFFEELNKYSETYEFSFQFWGKHNNHVYINKGGIVIHEMYQFETIEKCLKATLDYIYKINRVPRVKRVC